jgi:isoleucyl-tRNA synthetase
VRTIEYTADEEKFVSVKAEPDFMALGPRLQKDMKKVVKAVTSLSEADIKKFVKEGKVTLEGYEITKDEIKLVKSFKGASTQ